MLTYKLLASIHSMATPFGSFTGGILSENIGRLRSLQLCILPMVIGWIIIVFSPNISVLLVGRFFCGFAVGIVAATANVSIIRKLLFPQ